MQATLSPTTFSPEEIASVAHDPLPRSIAIIPDGNRRWARMRGVSTSEGHRSGADNLMPTVRAAHALGVREMIFYLFSTENWSRNPLEVKALMKLFQTYLLQERAQMLEDGVQLHVIGDRAPLSQKLLATIEETERATAGGTQFKLVLAFNYGARDEIARAARRLARAAARGELSPEAIDEAMLSRSLDTAPFADPDLLIRTSGEKRLSNFLLWQTSYTEFYTTSAFWPDFSPHHLLQAVRNYQTREQRKGG